MTTGKDSADIPFGDNDSSRSHFERRASPGALAADRRLKETVLTMLAVVLFADAAALFIDPYPARALVLLVFGAFLLGALLLAWRGILFPGRFLAPLVTLVVLFFFITNDNGLHDVAMVGLGAVPILASVLLGARAAIGFGVLTVIAVIGVGLADMSGLLPGEVNRLTAPGDIAIVSVLILAITAIQRFQVAQLSRSLEEARRSAEAQAQANREWLALKASLEQRVEARTRELRASADVGHTAASILDPGQLMREVVSRITDHFGFYYAAIFTLDESGRYAVLREATGPKDAGRVLKERGHRLEVGGQSMVGFVTAHRKARIALDVGVEPARFAVGAIHESPLLSDTRSEIALPLVAGDRVLGALDVQSTEEAAFDESSAAVLQTMADQVATALENARLFADTQAALDDARQSQWLMRTMIDSTPDWIFVKDQQHRYRLVNKSYAGALHVRTEDFIGKTDLELGFPEEQVMGNPEKGIRGSWNDDRLVMDSGQAHVFEEDPATVDGVVHTFHTIKTPLRDSQGRVWGVLAFARDITERKQAEAETQEALRELDRLYRLSAREGWTAYRQSGTLPTGYLFDRATLKPAGDVRAPEVEEAVRKQALVSRRRADQPVVAAPLSVRGEIVGALGVYDDPQHPLSAEDLSLVESVSEQLAQALDSARLFERTQQQLADLTIIQGAMSALAVTLTRDETINTVLAQVTGAVQADSASMFLLEDDHLVRVGRFPAAGDALLGQTLPLADYPLTRQVVETRRAMAYAADDVRLQEHARRAFAAAGITASATIPLISREGVLGTLAVSARQPGRLFDEHDLDLLQILADQATIAFERVTLLEETRRLAHREQLVNQIAGKLRAAVSVDEALRIATEELRQATRARRAVALFNPPERDGTT